MNLQAICDHKLRFIDIDLSHPASTSDYLAFCTSSILPELEKDDFLKPGLCLYGDNAYVNTQFMVSPFKGISSGSKDACNFFQSQIRINIECAFGVLVSRWGILRKAIPMNITITKISSLVRCLCILHNFCINDSLDKDGIEIVTEDTANIVPPTDTVDSSNIMISGGINRVDNIGGEYNNDNIVEDRLDELLDGGQHFDDTNHYYRLTRNGNQNEQELPRTKMLDKLIIQGYESRPTPRSY